MPSKGFSRPAWAFREPLKTLCRLPGVLAWVFNNCLWLHLPLCRQLSAHRSWFLPLKGLLKAGCKIRRFDGLTESPGKGQKEGQENLGTLGQLGGNPLALFSFPGPPGLPSGSPLSSLSSHQTCLSYSLLKTFQRPVKRHQKSSLEVLEATKTFFPMILMAL